MRRIRRILAELEAAINVPIKRVTLREALGGELPKILPSGENLYVSYADVEEFSRLVPEEDRDSVYIPIALVRRVDLGSGVFAVPKEDKKALAILLGEEREYLSKPEVAELARRFPSLIHIMILGTGVDEEYRAEGVPS